GYDVADFRTVDPRYGTNRDLERLFRDEKFRDTFQGPGTEYGHSFFDPEGKGDILRFLKHYREHLNATREYGVISVPSGNHDLARLNCGRSRRDLKLAFAFLWTLPGPPCLYAGDEIGM